MRWVLKAASQKALSALPHAESLNYLLQHRVTRTLPAGESLFRRKVAIGIEHFHAFREHGAVEPAEAVFYEFGAGWDLAVPLLYTALGVERQLLVDIRPNLRFELIDDSLRKHARHRAALEAEAGVPLRELDPRPVTSAEELRTRFGIAYLAPRDARETNLPGDSVDFVSSTDTLEHIPRDDLARILVECRRLLRAGGVLSCKVDMQDHYSYFDRGVSRYNFLRFPSRTWRLVNSSLHYQNRLRHPDYVTLVEEAGLEVVSDRVSEPSEADLEALRTLELAPEFRGYTLEQLGAKSLRVVARKPR